ncbi:Crp/Fnr family transcriptional regulator [Clostridium sp. YIM B02505]|uniref:Crp/Fnr family transcriptional regulator n=1 Tax=Clostridium yunnanense TaxID=2800325 RepID=A0ABS1ES35_9CLOT|nr:Crp/Fnr family transcriptional regulator [Clostridium yunnanense]MBK1812198.1 Crp/Fnr family transcriptional regulator [Clostridium yunnanense]
MNKDLIEFMEKSTSLSREEIIEIAKNIVVNRYSKKTQLLRQGEVADKCYFVLAGCIRQYKIGDDGREVTINFFTENQAAVIFKSYKQRTPSEYFLSCVEDSIVIEGDLKSEEDMYSKFPMLEKITRTMIEQNFGEEQEERASFMAAVPEERFRMLLKKRPGLINRVPQHQLASYLGITPESLSRIKKRVSKDSLFIKP